MLLALVGVTGVGKTFFKDLIVEELGFKKVNTIRTRKIRQGEQSGKVGLFMTSEELDELEKENKLAYRFSVFGSEYAYLAEEVFSDENYVFEMHYTTIYDWKKVRPDIKTIYILPKSLDKAKEQTKKRNLDPVKEQERIKEIDEHYNRIMQDENLRSQFDYVVYNKYDDESKKEILDLVRKLVKEEKV